MDPLFGIFLCLSAFRIVDDGQLPRNNGIPLLCKLITRVRYSIGGSLVLPSVAKVKFVEQGDSSMMLREGASVCFMFFIKDSNSEYFRDALLFFSRRAI